MKPSLRKNPDYFVLHIGTNDINSNRSPKLIAMGITDVGSSLKNDSHDLSISSIVVRNDKFKEKTAQVNESLKRLCAERNIYFINHAKNVLPQHLNKSKLHLNKEGTSILSSNFVKGHVFIWPEETGDKDSYSEGEKNKSKSVDASVNCSILGSLRRKHLKKLIIEHPNINSLRNKFEFLVDQIKGKVDVLIVSETKLNESFPQGQLKISGFSWPFRLHRNSNGGGIMLFVREDIPAKLIFTEVSPIEGFHVEIYLRKKSGLYVVLTTLINIIYVNTMRHWVKALTYFFLIIKMFFWW